MTREEAISELQKAIDLIKQNGKDWLDERDIPILQMAITALELSDSIMLQLDCKMFHSGVNVESAISEATPSTQFAKDTNVPCNDTISRQRALDTLREAENHAFNSYYKGLAKAHKIIADLPSAQPEPIKITIDHAPIPDELERLKQAMRNTPVMLFPSAQPEITPDGTLKVTVDADIASVGRILLSQAGTQRGGLYYKDEQPEIIRCKDCKYGDRGIDEDGNPFLKCLGWVYGGTQEKDFCSHAERRTDDER